MLGWRGALLCACLSQLWTLTPGNADKDCRGFGHLENGRMYFRYGGLYVAFTCNPGFRIYGYRTSSCVSGQWARVPPLCVASGCLSPGDLLHGSTVVSEDRSLAFFNCDTGFTLFGSALLYCKGNGWNGTKPVCKVADIMSLLHLKQEMAHDPVPASLKDHLHGHFNTLSVTASKDVFLSKTLFGDPHIQLDLPGDQQKNIRKLVEKKHSKSPLFNQTWSGGKVEPESFKDPVRNAHLQKPVSVSSSNVNTISLTSSFHKSSFSTTTTTSFVTSVMESQPIKNVERTFTETPYARNKKGFNATLGTDEQRVSITSTAETSPEYIKNNTYWKSNTPEPSMDALRITEDPKNSATKSFASPAISFPGFILSKPVSVSSTPLHIGSTATSACRERCDQRPDHQKSPPTIDPNEHLPSSMNFMMTTTRLVPGLLLRSQTDVHYFTDVDHKASDGSNQSEHKQTHDHQTWKDLPRFTVRKRPVCPYPPFPSHGTFYFRSIKNPDPFQYKHYVQYACYPGYTLTNGNVYSYCQHNGQWSGQTPLCLELTPCTLNNGGCSQICHVNEQNRAQCLCKPGFLLLEDQRTCRDLDECVEELHHCQQACGNTLGSYRCSCRAGFQLSTDGTSCTDVDECQHVGRALCVSGCINTPGSFRCLCPKGYQLDNSNGHCTDINECEESKVHTCEWKCVNGPGTYRCVCPRGYRLQPNGHQCEDINECELKRGSCSHLCVNHRGGYKCACPETHRISPYNRKICLPIDVRISSSH